MVRVVYHPQPGQEEHKEHPRAGKKNTGQDQANPASNKDAPNQGTGRHSSLTTSHRLDATRSRHSTPRTRGSRIISRPTAATSDQVSMPILCRLDLSCTTKKRSSMKIVTTPYRYTRFGRVATSARTPPLLVSVGSRLIKGMTEEKVPECVRGRKAQPFRPPRQVR